MNDPPRSVTFTAGAIHYGPSAVVLQVNDADGPYVLTEVGQTVMEAFDSFSGGHDPAPWVRNFGNWLGEVPDSIGDLLHCGAMEGRSWRHRRFAAGGVNCGRCDNCATPAYLTD